jgi:hypothetical protein
VHDDTINQFITPLPPARLVTLSAYLKRAASASGVIDAVADSWAATVERLGDVDVNALAPRLTRDAFICVARVKVLAAELRDLLDRRDAVDLVAARRAARGAKTDLDFATAIQLLEREVERHEGKAKHVTKLAGQISNDLDSLTELEIWSAEFVIQQKLTTQFTATV